MKENEIKLGTGIGNIRFGFTMQQVKDVMGEPEEIARCVVFLAADEAGFITGSTLSANGGQYMI